jgi:hypothetical protein
MPERPHIEEASRMESAHVLKESQGYGDAFSSGAALGLPAAPSPMAMMEKKIVDLKSIEKSIPVQIETKELGELFQYTVNAPITVGRGQSAIVPILSSNLVYHKDLLFNQRIFTGYPVVSLRFKNQTGLTLERGPVTVVEDGQYIGEAVLPFTPKNGEVILPYAVELGVKVDVDSADQVEMEGLGIKNGFFMLVEWEIHRTEYRIHNHTSKEMTLLIEHPRKFEYELFDTPNPIERTEENYRFEILLPLEEEEREMIVLERHLRMRREELQTHSLENLRRYLEKGMLDKSTFDRLTDLFAIWDKISQRSAEGQVIAQERDKVYKAQEHIRSNVNTLSKEGTEGEVRAGYVKKLQASEEVLAALAQKEKESQAEIERLKLMADELMQKLESTE